ncbi:beta-galactosidase trimerization domain-containing protein [Candidatus Latescibacterota bacterium]
MTIKIILLLVSFLSLNAHGISAENAENAEDFDNSNLHYTRVDTTLHQEKYPILSPLKQGALKVLFIGRYDRVAPISIDIAARLDCNIETILTRSRTEISYENPGETNSVSETRDSIEEDSADRLERLLGYDWDAIWLNFNIQSLSENIRNSILDHCSAGAGLVYVGERKDIDSYETRGKIDEESLEVVSYESVDKTAAIRCKNGIIVVIPPVSSDIGPLGAGDYYNIAANSILFASAPQTGTRITRIQMPRKQIEQEVAGIMKFRVHLVREDNPETMTVNIRFRNEKGEIVHESADKFAIQSGKSFIILNFVQFPIGAYSVDVSVSDSEGIASFAGSSFQVMATDKIADVNLWNISAKEGDFIIGTVETSSPIKEGIIITAELNDSRGECIEKFNVDLVPGRMSADFTFKIKQSLSRLIFIKLRFYKNNELIHTVEKPLFIERRHDPYVFSFIVNNDSDSGFLLSEKYKTLAGEGVNIFAFDVSRMQSPDMVFDAALEASQAGTGIIPLLSNSEESLDNEKNDVWEQRLKSIIDTLKHVDPVVYLIELNDFTMNYEKQEEKPLALEALETFDQNRRKDSYAGWMDTHRNGFTEFEQLYSQTANIISNRDSTALIGISDFNPSANITNGYKLNKLAGVLDMIMPRLTIDTAYSDIGASRPVFFNAQDHALKGFLFSGELRNGNKQYLHYIPWYTLFNGMNSIWWDNMYGGNGAALTPQMKISPPFSIVAEELREIMAGVDKLILKSERLDDGIAIFYSPESILAAYTSKSGNGRENQPSKASASAESFYLACSDLGFTPSYISDNQLDNNLLENNNCSVLFLPYSQAVSDKSIDVIKEFVKRGGTVIADMRPAVMDENLLMRESGEMDEVFGISQSTERISPEISGTFNLKNLGGDNMDFPYLSFDCTADPTLIAIDTAEVFANIDDYPAVIMNEFGEGRGIFLNMGMDRFSELRFPGEGNVYSDIISMCLKKGGIKPPFAVVADDKDDNIPGVGLSLFKDGDADYIGLIAEPSEKNMVKSGIKTLNIKIENTGMTKYVYDIRNRKFLGAKDTVFLEMTPGRAELFALLPYRVQQINLNLKTSIVHSGGRLDFGINIISHDPSMTTGRHVLRVRIMRADNKEISYYNHSVETVNGNYSESISILSDDKPGRWILEVYDIISGKKTEKGFIVSNM